MSENTLEIIPTEIIRTETALSRFPIHRLSKKGEISIDIKVKNDKGELKTKWKVSHNSDFGQPSPLAYKVDTLIINRKIEEAGKPVPKLIKLGSLKEIARELKLGGDTSIVKNSLLQNAAAFISAKFTYKTTEGTERTIEIGDTRYAIVFTGEQLPNGNKADATYIQLHDLYREILNSAPTRPLDYEYLKELSPIAQRFYELLSYQMFGALKHKRTAKMLYSEFCTYAPQTRFFDWEQVRPQMYRLHKPHLESGYIETVNFEKLRSEDGTQDWLFTYTAGRKAKGEHTFATTTKKSLPRAKEIKSSPSQPLLIPDEPRPTLIPDVELTFTDDEETLISKMREFRVTETKARSLVKSHREAVEREIEYFPHRDPANAKNAAGLFVKAVLENYEPPQSYFESQKAAETKKQNEKQNREAVEKRKDEDRARQAQDRAKRKLDELPEDERQKLWEAKRAAILTAPENQNKSPKILNSVIEGMIHAEIVADFIEEERQTADNRPRSQD